MAKVKVNDDEFTEIGTHIVNASKRLEEAEVEWGTNFDNLYQRFVESGFLDALYEDAESTYHTWSRGLSAVSMTASGAALGLTFGPIGGIIGAVIGAIFGIVSCVLNEPTWLTVSKEAFKTLLNECRYGNNDCYIQISNTYTKLYNCQLAMENIKSKINLFQQTYANLYDSATAVGLDGQLMHASDGITVLGVETSVQINGQEIKMSVSDAMNAFYTYTDTVTSGVIAADYLERTYGYEVDYNKIVSEAGGFITDTVNSGLYSHEFVDVLLPQYTPDLDAAYDAVVNSTTVKLDELKSALVNNSSFGGEIALYSGLLGAAFMGAVSSGLNTGEPGTTTPGTTTPGTTTPGTTTPGTTTPGTTTPGTTIPGATTPGTTDPGASNPEDDKPEDDEPEDEIPEDTPVNEIEIVEIEEHELPENVLFEGEIDFDKLAREALGFDQSVEDILARRAEIINDIDRKFEMGDLDSLKDELKEYGYNDAEIEAIIKDKDMLTRAILEGDQRAQLAQKAMELAKEAGIEDYDTSFDDRPDYASLSDEGPSELLTIYSENKELVEMHTELKEFESAYETAVEDTNKLLGEVAEAKADMDAILEKYTEKYGEDTTKWSEDAAEQYNESIESYNESVNKAQEQMKVLEEAKEKYKESREEFDKAKKDYFDDINSDHEENAGIVGDDYTNSDVGGSQDANTEGPVISNDDLLGMINNNNGNITINN